MDRALVPGALVLFLSAAGGGRHRAPVQCMQCGAWREARCSMLARCFAMDAPAAGATANGSAVVAAAAKELLGRNAGATREQLLSDAAAAAGAAAAAAASVRGGSRSSTTKAVRSPKLRELPAVLCGGTSEVTGEAKTEGAVLARLRRYEAATASRVFAALQHTCTCVDAAAEAGCKPGEFYAPRRQQRAAAGAPASGQTTGGVCVYCPRGKFSAQPAAHACTPCPAGKYQPFPRRSAAGLRGGAFYRARELRTLGLAGLPFTRRLSQCYACPVGKHAASAHAVVCAPCFRARGQTQPFTGQARCYKLRAGVATTAMAPGGAAAAQRSAAAFEGERVGHGVVHCGPGAAPIARGSLQCRLCPPGRSAPASGGAQACRKCARGRFQPKRGQARCAACPTGKFQQVPGMAFCFLFPKARAPPPFEPGRATSPGE
jgi:hypothetical protein